MMQIRPYEPADFAAVVAFVARLNSDPAHHIGYFGTESDEIRSALSAVAPPLVEGFRLAVEAGQIIGVLGVELDHALGRAWLFGPIVDHANPDAVADELYAALRPAIPSAIQGYELFCDAANQMCQRFAMRHSIPFHGESAVLYCERSHMLAVPSVPLADLDVDQVAAFCALHQHLFPNTYAPAQRLLASRSDHARIIAIGAHGQLQGYVAVKVEPDVGTGYIDYIGVAETARQRGIGRTLLAAAVQWMFSFPTVQRTDLTVTTSNVAALALYRSLGFQHDRVMRAYRSASAPL